MSDYMRDFHRTETYLIPVSRNLAQEESIEICISGVLSAGTIVHQYLERSELVVIEGSMVTGGFTSAVQLGGENRRVRKLT